MCTIDTALKTSLVAQLGAFRYILMDTAALGGLTFLASKVPSFLRTGKWPISNAIQSRWIELGDLYYAVCYFELLGGALLAHHSDETWYKILMHHYYGLVTLRNQAMVDNVTKILSQPDAPLLSVAMGSAHVNGIIEELMSKRGFKNIPLNEL